MLFTSRPVNLKIKETIRRIVEIYFAHWKCDESFRYIKQCYNLEDIRVRHHTSLRSRSDARCRLFCNLKLKMLVQRIYLVSKRFFGASTFFNYAIAEGPYNLLFPDKTGIKGGARTKKPEFQLCFSFWEESG